MTFLPTWLWFAAIALIFWGITGITQKLSTNRISSELSFLWFAGAMIEPRCFSFRKVQSLLPGPTW